MESPVKIGLENKLANAVRTKSRRFRTVSGETRAAILHDGHSCAFHPQWGLTYQTCRFCKRGSPELEELIKYSVRHYICADCRKALLIESAEEGWQFYERHIDTPR